MTSQNMLRALIMKTVHIIAHGIQVKQCSEKKIRASKTSINKKKKKGVKVSHQGIIKEQRTMIKDM